MEKYKYVLFTSSGIDVNKNTTWQILATLIDSSCKKVESKAYNWWLYLKLSVYQEKNAYFWLQSPASPLAQSQTHIHTFQQLCGWSFPTYAKEKKNNSWFESPIKQP